MVGLVLVSHSAGIAAGAAELAAQMAGPGVRIGVAGGLDQPGDPLGTDATRVLAAIEAVWSEDGVLVLMDLGSAVLSAEMAVDLLDEERRGRVLLTDAPLVEGAVAAAVAAAVGEPIAAVAEAARRGLAGKAAQLAPAHEPAAAVAAAPTSNPQEPRGESPSAESLRLTVRNRLGLHARPAAALVRTVAAFAADVTVADTTNGRGPVSARSLSAVATLGVRAGDQIEVRASGGQADEALAAVRRLAGEDFGEPREEASERAGPPAAGRGAPTRTPADAGPSEAPAPGTVLRGLPASPGVAVGAARHLRPARPEIPDGAGGSPAAERDALDRALAATADDVRCARTALSDRARHYDSAIFDAHLLFLEDAALLEPTRERIAGGESAARAWSGAVGEAAAAWDALDDPHQRARAADLRSVGGQVLSHLAGTPALAATAGAGVIVASDLRPAEVAALDPDAVTGVALSGGGPLSHAVILIRALGLPAVVDAGPSLLAVAEGALLEVDGDAGTVRVEPAPGVVAAAARRVDARAREASEALAAAGQPAVTRDGVRVAVEANMAETADAPVAVAAGADGIGLLRTEFLFRSSAVMPGEDEQVAAYAAVAVALGGRPLTIRTLDSGADKPLPCLSVAAEANPSLGVRGVRLGLARPDLLACQLRAVLRVAAEHPVRVMFPMVSTVEELTRARELLEEARAALEARGTRVPARLDVGVMVEVPSAALISASLASLVDFFSIGTNDLAQYTFAAERGNAGVAALADPLHPAVLQLIDRTARAAAAAGKRLAVCGEMAADRLCAPLLIGLGVRELSMNAAAIPAAKQAVRAVDAAAARALADEALAAGTAAAVRRLCGGSSEG
jgi:phosphoenolpyruvate-protein phosphotransferase/dihydroxyacetone kinase phosphotransfer subunit